jgi:WD40 repeat protein
MAQVSPRLAAVLTKMVRSHWRDRYPSVQSVLLDLQGLRSQASPASHSEPLLKRMALLTAAMMLMGGISQVPNVQHIMRLGLAAIATWMPDSIVSVPLSQTSDGMIVPLKMVDSESGSVLAIAMHPRGKVAASGGKNKLIQLWDVESGVMLNDLTGHLQEISALSFAPDGATLASGSGDATVKIWDLKSGVLRHTLVGHQGRVNAVQITPDGRWAVSGGSDRRIKIWDLASGKEQQTLTGHEGAIQTLEISSDGNFLFSGSQDKTIRVWELSTGRVVQTLTGHRSGVDAIAITPDNQTLISGAEDQIIVWDRFTGKKARTFTQSVGTHALRFSEDGRYLLSAHTDGTLKVWNWQTGSLIKTVRGHSDDVTAIAICRNYRTLVTASLDHRLGIWRLHL